MHVDRNKRIRQLASWWLCAAALLVTLGCAKGKLVYEAPGGQSNKSLIPGIEEGGDGQSFVLVTAIGQGVPPESGSAQQKMILARRAAVVDAYRNLSERLTGMLVQAYTQQGQNLVSVDQINLQTTSYLRGARIIEVDYEDGLATAKVLVSIRPKTLAFH